MSYAEIKETICHGFRWNYNDIDVEITWRCQIGEHQYYPIPIVRNSSFKIMIDSFTQNGLNMIILYVISRPQSVCVPISARPSNSVSRGKRSLLSDDLLQMIGNTMFDNPFAKQHRFDYSELSDNKDDDALESNVMVNIDDDVDKEIIPLVSDFEDAFGSSFVVSNDYALSYRRISKGSELELNDDTLTFT
uniref:Uncharacterized protein n=1 Tax=Populus trichocarpa TaxID=3694 RepID=A0A2K1XCT1_POPTR